MSKRNEKLNVSVGEAIEAATIKNTQDLGYRFAAHVDADKSYVEYALGNIPNFPDKAKIEDVYVEQFKAGAMLRYSELQKGSIKHYLLDGEDTFIETDKPGQKGGFECSVAYCVGLPKHEFGALKPNKKALVKRVRDAANNYCDLRWSRLLQAGNAAKTDKGPRKPNTLFQPWLDKILVDILNKAKKANSDGDSTAVAVPTVMLAIAAFKNQMKAGDRVEQKAA